jgi:hypothetical protein
LREHRDITSGEDQIKIRNKFHEFLAVCRRGLLKMMEFGRKLARQEQAASQQNENIPKEKEKTDEVREAYVENFNLLLEKLDMTRYKILDIKEGFEDDEGSENEDYEGGTVKDIV